MQRKVVPVILCGGGGKRLWPASRGQYPKQFLKLTGELSLFQATADRVRDRGRFEAPIVVANREYRFIVEEQLEEIGIAPDTILLEPAARNTAPALAAAAMYATDRVADAIMLVQPADHMIANAGAFESTVQTAAAAAAKSYLVTLGMQPTSAETGYGYIKLGEALEAGVHSVANFIEKPDRETAERLVSSGDYLWNSGMFVFPAALLIDEVNIHIPAISEVVRRSFDERRTEGRFCYLSDAFNSAQSISVDYAVMERTRRAIVVPGAMSWTDVGSWDALWAVGEKDQHGNVRVGEAVLVNARGNYVRSSGPLVAILGVSDLAVVVTDDAVLVAPRAASQDVRKIVEELDARSSKEAEYPKVVYRPWGHYESIQIGERYQVKRIVVKPGAQLSLQKHFHRAEHWVVVNGTAVVTRENEEILLRENESTFLPLGCMHRLSNPGKIPLTLIEVQSGAYLGEDDIVRVQDDYNRA
ncbi:mannose-1-phosphate guanylyltransferase/mannose-6-phosphate isomerase [Chelatococcus reniformis]|uniref:mannose-1-phosphate guanylyltransferase n=1 Tax=Chelatococcus reniformis TaxID=1494448 RepID=A0A916UXB4_9HYPH|nr:mannose-1-phosphate guanylyltransferase/mannose-6-phosphate isomerase [Chelatococcus reniformis]GGC91293.1 GDP-mannose pyrophosphorylase [Chelatococcus reniformis]